MADRWWTCTHEGVGLPGCPTCDGTLSPGARMALRDAREEIGRLTAALEGPAAGEQVMVRLSSGLRPATVALVPSRWLALRLDDGTVISAPPGAVVRGGDDG